MQGRFKRDGSASAEPEPHNGTARGASPQHAQGQEPDGDAAAPVLKPAGGGSTGPGSRIALRNWRISTRLVSLLALPVVAATTLGGLRISDSLEDMQQLENMQLLTEMTKQATELATALQEERDVTAGPLAHGGADRDYKVKTPREKTDRAKSTFLKDTEAVDDQLTEGELQGVRDSLVGLVGELRDLDKLRKNAYDSKGNATQTVESYHRLITQLLDLSTDMAEATSNPEMIQRTRALAAFSSAKEYASMQRAVIAAALPKDAASFAKLSENDRLYGEAAIGSEKSELDAFQTIYGSGAKKTLEPLGNNSVIEAADKYADTVLSPKGTRNVNRQSYQDWVDDASTKLESMESIEHTLLEEMEQKARELQDEAQREALISGVLILVVLGVSLVGAFVVARSMIRSLRRLQDTATKVAKDRLPELVKQLSENDPQDVDTTVESVGVHSRDEIGQVASAFDDVHREAVRLAAEQALLRGNVNAMFTNLSRRSQGLIQRQLTLISELESREADPDQLSSLFKLDHLATRMRRNGENLLVLAGEEPGRRWTRPVPLVDVLRAAASEVEQYERIELSTVPKTEIAGRVVNDLVHLLAELLENATSFSSPQTKVRVTGHALPDGRALIEIHDTGIGLSPEDLSAINERLAAPPTVDVSVSRRMGLFVVGRLSQRHGIRIQLRPSDSGGTTALVMLPVDVAQGDKKAVPGKGQGGGGVAAAAAGAAAARRGGAGAALGSGARPALPARDSGGGAFGQGGSGGQGGTPAGAPGQGRPTAGAGFGGPSAQAPQAGFPAGPAQQQNRGSVPAQRTPQQGQGVGPAGGQGRGQGPGAGQQNRAQGGQSGQRQPQLPPPGGPRAELPGGARPADGPRGHDDFGHTSQLPRVDDQQGPGSTAQFPRPDFDGPAPQRQPQAPGVRGPQQGARPQAQQPQAPQQYGNTGAPAGGQYPQQGYPAAPQDPSSTGQFPAPGQYQDPSSTGQFPAPGQYQDPSSTGQFPAPGQYQDPSSTGQFAQPPADGRQQYGGGYGAQQQPAQGDLPPVNGHTDGGTPLFDSLETNWFRGQQQQAPGPQGQQQYQQQPQAGRPAPQQQAPGQPRRPQQPQAPQRSPQQPAQQPPAPQRPGAQAAQRPSAAPWRSSPNDELSRQAERARKPSAGGVTTSGLPKRVPKANLVPGTAQQNQHTGGPQVSRAPDAVRGRLTNLRRGIAQGRQATSGQTGSFPNPTHQQER
ncbi:nitrate- and nitrite sensing domain-containing protein [Streptomyces sp. NPDC056600]|uniref:sensor histidine kinase n=1 Tax=Streptomyces sp. NPDC056600 TaxID=3345874 RepID=UPI0036C5E5F8